MGDKVDIEHENRTQEPYTKKTIVSDSRSKFELPCNISNHTSTKQTIKPQNLPGNVPDSTNTTNLVLELLEAKADLATKTTELAQVSNEVLKLRQELEHCLGQLENYR